MVSRKINALLLLMLGFFTLSGFKQIEAIAVKPAVVSENKDTLVNSVVINENNPVKIKYGTKNPINEILSVVQTGVKNEYEEFKFEGITELQKQKYVARNSELLITNYVSDDFGLKEVVVETRKFDQLITNVQVEKYRVLVKIVDAKAPEISLRKEKVKITEGNEYNPKTNVKEVIDNEQGKITTFEIEGEFDKNKAGEYTVKAVAVDHAGNKSEAPFTIVVEKKPQVSYSSSDVSGGAYSYLASEGGFAYPDLSHRAAVNGAEPGNCTWYVYNRLSQLGAPIPYRKMGNGGEWAYYAKSYGYSVNKTARTGTVWSTQGSYYGHVAFVEKVNADGSMVISEMNRNGLYKMNFRTVSASEARRGYFIDFGLAR